MHSEALTVFVADTERQLLDVVTVDTTWCGEDEFSAQRVGRRVHISRIVTTAVGDRSGRRANVKVIILRREHADLEER